MIEVLAKEMPKFQDKLKDLPNESTVKELGEVKTPINPLEYSLGTIENQSLDSLKIENKCAAESKETSRQLTEKEIEYYKDKLGCSEYLLKNATIDENGVIHIKTINEGKEGQEGENGVKYERKTIVINGVEVEGVFPVFESAAVVQLPEELLKASDAKQMDYCNQKLKEEVENDPELAKKFTPEQLEQIKNGETPDGYTWHHNEKSGKMELVRTDDHQANRHTGGKAIWGGGNENR